MMSGIIAELLTVAKKLNNYEIYSASGTLWTSTTVYTAVVPAGKRWFVLGGLINRNVSSTISIRVYDAADKHILNIGETAAATAYTTWPCTVATGSRLHGGIYPIILDAGEYVTILFGTAQDTSSWATCVVLEIDV